MKQPVWKKLLSYLFELHLESAPSETNPHLYISLKNGRYQLCTSRAIYSYEDLYSNFRQAFQNLNWEKIPGQKVLLLGFGLGSIPYMLEHIFHKEFEYSAVEKDEQVLYLAQKYVMDEIESQVVFHVTDAHQFVRSTREKFDLICMDVFVEDIIPAELQTVEFCLALSSMLTDHGVMLYNRLSRTKKDLKHTAQFFEEIFKEVFSDAVYLDVQGNWILSNKKDAFLQKMGSKF